MRTEHAATSLFRRCRRGNVEALRALLYGVADGLYAAALGASSGEAEAVALAEGAWEQLLTDLRGRQGRGDPRRRLREILREMVSTQGGVEVAEAALALWSEEPAEQAVAAPAELVQRLEEAAEGAAPELRRWARRRRRTAWVAWGVTALVLVGLALGGAEHVDRARGRQVRQVRLESLLERVREERLAWTVRDQLLSLPDPQGVDRTEAARLAQAVLVLEEVTGAARAPARLWLPYLQERLEDGELVEALRQMALEAPEEERGGLMRAVLVLEEVRVL